jgi:O-antigen ligase
VDRLRPWLLGGATALFVCRPLFAGEGAIADGDGLPVVMLWIVAAVVWMLGAVGRPHFRVRFSRVDAALVLLVTLLALSTLWAVHTQSPRPAINALFEWLGLGLGFFLLRQFIAGPRQQRAVVAVMAALAAAVACYGLYQVFFELPATRAFYAADPEGALRNLGIPPQLGPVRQLFESRLQNHEPLATFALTNSLAGFLTPWLVLTLGIGIFAWSRGRLDRRTAVAVACTAIPLAICLLLTKSRSGYSAVVVGILATGWACRGSPHRLGWKLPTAVAAAIVVLATAALGTGVLPRSVLGRASTSFGYRLQYWQSTLHMIGDHWWAGCGPGNFQNVYTRYKLPEASEEVADPHNFLLEIWATAGTPAMLAFLALLGFFVAAMRRHNQWQADCQQKAAAPAAPRVMSEPDGNLRVPCSLDDRTETASMLATHSCPRQAWAWHPFFLKSARFSVSLLRGYARSGRAESGDGPDPQDRPAFVVGGAALGLLLSIPFGLIGSVPPSPAMVLMAIPVMVGLLAMWWKWIHHGWLPPLAPAIAAAALLVNLSAAGGMSIASVAGSFWLLLAVGLTTVDFEQTWRLPRLLARAGLLATLLGMLVCYTFAYAPVLACQAAMRAAERIPLRREVLLQAAVAHDPWAARPWQSLAALALDAWREQPDDQRQRQFERYNSMMLEVDSTSAALWLASGDAYFEIAMKTHRPRDLQQAIDSYRHAVERYPNSGEYRAKLALALHAAGQTAEFRQEAERALKFDGLTPHVDKKLDEETRKQLREGVP